MYLGRLSESDPLHGYLRYDIHPQVTNASANTNYRVFRLNGSNDVYLYENRRTGAKVVGTWSNS